jgi:hypothetical protein
MRTRTRVYAALAVLAAVCGIFVLFARAIGNLPVNAVRLELFVQPPNILGAIAMFFVLPAVARTVRPEFVMTVGRVFGVIGVLVALGVVVDIGFILLIVPGVYMLGKWSQTVWTYVLSDGKNPFGESFEITKGHFWHTLGFALLLGIAVVVPLAVVVICAAAIAGAVPLLAVVLSPLAFLAYVFVMHVLRLGEMRWMLACANFTLGQRWARRSPLQSSSAKGCYGGPVARQIWDAAGSIGESAEPEAGKERRQTRRIGHGMGRSQVVRQGTLNPPFVGSNPAAPALRPSAGVRAEAG